MIRQLQHLMRLGVVATAWLGATSMACSKQSTAPPAEPPALTAANTMQTFRFAPPDGTRFVRHDRRKEERAIVGTPIRATQEDELQWKVEIDRDGDRYHVKQDLVHIALKRDGALLASGNVSKGISAELVIDRDGNLMEVRGLEKTAENLRELAAPGMEAAVAQALTPEYLSSVIANRYRLMFGETVGRQAMPGSTWTVTNPPGSFVASRKVTVERMEPCGTATCARMRVDFNVDARVLGVAAVAMVKDRVQSLGGDPSKVAMRSAKYGISGAMLNEPATMLSHGAALLETGSVTVMDPEQKELTVEMKGSTEIAYAYEPAHLASAETR